MQRFTTITLCIVVKKNVFYVKKNSRGRVKTIFLLPHTQAFEKYMFARICRLYKKVLRLYAEKKLIKIAYRWYIIACIAFSR
jgi:hypothetical protein